MKKKYLSMVLALSMVAGLTACGNNASAPATTESTAPAAESQAQEQEEIADTETADTEEAEDGEEAEELSEYDQASTDIYNAQLGEFAKYYEDAKENAATISERYAKMALAEAKLMESAVMLPTNTRGGLYAMSRVAYGTSTTTLWGNDYKRYHRRLITTDFIKTVDRDEMKAKWVELKGTGTLNPLSEARN